MRYNGGTDIALANELLNSGVPVSRVKEIFKNRIDDEELEDVIKETRDYDGPGVGAIAPDIRRLVDEAKAPDDFLDPLYLHLMKDPVVLSSGKTMDRSSVLDRDGNLLFSRCPFTGRRLSSDVYPVEDLKRQIDYFRMRRDSNITQIARKIISKGTFESFRDVLDAVEVQLKGLGDNYLPLARELAAIWSGVRNPPALMLLVDRLKIKGTNKWISAVASSRLEDKVYKILVSVETFNTHSIGARKSSLSLALYDEKDVMVQRCKLFEDSDHRGNYNHRSFGKRDRIVTTARAGYTYRLEYLAANTDEYFKVEGLICKIIPMSAATTSYRMRDGDGEDGLYIGSTNVNKDANGEGSLEYDNGNRFVGSFKSGNMMDGVLYRGSHIRQTMKRGKWTNTIDDVIVEKFPSNMIVFDHAGDTINIELKRRMRRLDELHDSERGKRHSQSNFGKYGTCYDHDESVHGMYSSRYMNQGYNKYRDTIHSRGKYDDRSRHSRSGRHALDDSYVPYHVRSQKSLLDDDLSLSRRNNRLPIVENLSFTRPSRSIDDDMSYEQSTTNLAFGDVFPDMRGSIRHKHASDRRGYNHEGRLDLSGKDSDEFDNRLGNRQGKDLGLGGVFPDLRKRPGNYYSVDDDGDAMFAHTHENDRIGTPQSSHYSREKYPIQGRDDSSYYSHGDSRRSNYQQNYHDHHNDFADDEYSRHSRNERPQSGYHSNISSKEEKYLDEMFGEMNSPKRQNSSLSRHSLDNVSSPINGRSSSRDSSSFPMDRLNQYKMMGGQKSNSLGMIGTKNNSLGMLRGEIPGKKSNSLGVLHESLERSASSDNELILPKYVRPYILHVQNYQKHLKQGGAWVGVTQTGYLEGQVKSLMISVDEFHDEKQKTNLGIALYDSSGQFIVRCNIFGNRTKTKGNFRLITNEEKIVAKAKAGYFYQLQVAVNTGSIDAIQVKNWICKIFPASTTLDSYHMSDNDGDKGYYFGPVNLRKQAHGKGILEYENGCTFVGLFAQGMLMKGAYYKIGEIKATMQSSKWNDKVDPKISRDYPQCIQTFRREVRSQDIVYDSDEESIQQAGSMCCS